ncbi:MAG: YlxR family protein [Clostridia bacterium]|nr:YlxR family protein [Clostridia bacterium]
MSSKQQKPQRKKPVRMCVGCRERFLKIYLIRVVRTPEGEVVIDEKGKLSGRGAYICRNTECLAKAHKSKALQRALEVEINDDLLNQLKEDIIE